MDKGNLKIAAQIALVSLAVLLLGSVVFYLERMLFLDASWVTYNILNTKRLFIQEHRYGSFITQMFPLTAAWLKLPLRWVLVLYSASFNLFSFLSAYILYRKKQYPFVILIALYFTVCVTESYFWTNNEVHQGMVWMLLLFGIWKNNEEQNISGFWPCLLFTLLAFLAVFAHPIIVIATALVLTFFLVENIGCYKNKRSLLYIGILLFIIAAKYYCSAHLGWYDEGRVSTLSSVSLKQIAAIPATETAQAFLHKCWNEYLQFSLIVLLGLIFLAIKKRYLLLICSILSLTAYFVCICIVYPECDLSFYIESEWMTISVIGSLAFVYFVIPVFPKRFLVFSLLVLFGFCFAHILSSADKFHARLNCIKEIVLLLQEKDMCKLVIEKEGDKDRQEQILMMSWGLPTETLILSNLDKQHKAVTAVKFSHDEILKRVPGIGKDSMLNTFYTESYTRLNPDYFRFDTTQTYQVVNLDLNLK